MKETYRNVLYILDKDKNVMRQLKLCRLECSILDQAGRILLGEYKCLGRLHQPRLWRPMVRYPASLDSGVGIPCQW